MRYAILLWAAVSLSFADSAAAQFGGWESATNTGQESAGGMVTRCYYRTLGGYEFTVNERGLCPFSVQVNPETREVRDTGSLRRDASRNSPMGSRWESAANTGQESAGGLVTRCYYRTLSGYAFNLDQRGLCSFSVQVNPETGEVRSPGTRLGNSTTEARWESASNTSQQSVGGMVTRCYYRTLGGYEFSVDRRGQCSFSVQVNVETGQVR